MIATTMAIPAFELHPTLDADLRYDLGRIAEVTGDIDLARAQADTILQQQENHLLGIILAANVARASRDTAGLGALNRKLLSVQSAELARNLTEYALHKKDIDKALESARGGR
jgi:hypothetical protein